MFMNMYEWIYCILAFPVALFVGDAIFLITGSDLSLDSIS